MQFSFDWIRQYVDFDEGAEAAAKRLTAAGLAVEGQEPRGSDVILDVDVTTNRPDCMNHLGLARELAALSGRPLVQPEVELGEVQPPASASVEVEVEDSVGCPRYVARVVRGVRVGPSPDWLVDRLVAIGQRSINNVVDITNFVLWELGQPIHAFDLDAVAGSRIVVRRAVAGEILKTLDGEQRRLDPRVLVIADAEKAVALAGIMGGLDSEVGEATTNVLIESAHFDPTRVRLGAAALGLHTDASHRFERGADPEICRLAADRVAALVAEVAGGEVLAEAVEFRNRSLRWQLEGTLDLERASRFGGVDLDGDEVERQLRALGFGLEPVADKAWRVEVPSWRYYDMRPDPNRSPGEAQPPVYEADLFEEVLRLHGFDDIPSTLPRVGGPDEGSSAGHFRREALRNHLAACGYSEVVTFAFHSSEADGRFPSLQSPAEPLRLANPLSELYNVMRRSMLPGLVEAAEFNLRRGAGSIRLFEIGHVFPGGNAPELEALALVAGGSVGSAWDHQAELDFFDLKGTIESLAGRSGFDLRFQPVALPGFIAGTSAQIARVGDGIDIVGYLGRLEIVEAPFAVFAAELCSKYFADGRVMRIRQPSRFPGVETDLTLTHAVEVSWENLADEILEARIEDLVDFGLQARYAGGGVPAGAVNTTIRFLYNSPDRSLTQDEVNERHEEVRRRLTDRFGWREST